MKDFRPAYIVFGFIPVVAILIITLIADYFYYNGFFYYYYYYFFIIIFISFITSWISVTLLFWIFDDKIEKRKYFRANYVYFGLFAAIAMLIITVINNYFFYYFFYYFYYFIVFITSWISVTLLCWILNDKIEKRKDFRAVYVYFGLFAAIVMLISTAITYYLKYFIIFITSWISVTLLCWFIEDKIEKKKEIIGIVRDTPNQVMDRIKEALEMKKPSKAEILTYLYNLQANDSLSNFEFFDIIGETYQLNPKFFMLSIFPKIRRKFSKIYGDEGMLVMNKYILEKFCLDEGEQIIYELNGKIRQKVEKKYTIKVLHGTIYVTNSRIIAHGNFEFHLYESAGRVIFDLAIGGPTKSHKKAKIAYISNSAPCYGYPFPIKNLRGLFNFYNRELSYFSVGSKITIIPSKKEENGDKLFAILDKFQIRK